MKAKRKQNKRKKNKRKYTEYKNEGIEISILDN